MPGAPCGGATLLVLIADEDLSCDVISVDIQRGRTRLWDPPSAADCQLVINAGKEGAFYYKGPPGATVSVSMSYGSSSRTIFTGTVQQSQVESTPEGTFLQLYAVDGFEQLSRVTRVAAITDTAVGASETVDERIGRWLDEADYSGSRSLTASLMTCPEIILGQDEPNVLMNIHHTAEADGGDFYFEGDGTATFKSWAWRNSVDSVDAVFSDKLAFDWVPYSSSVYRDDLDEVQNRVMGVRRKWDATDPDPQTADNPTSMTTYGERGDALTDLELEDDGQVATRVAGVVAAAAFPSPRFDPVVVQPRFNPARAWPRVLNVGWGSLIITNRVFPAGGSVGLFGHVIGERWKMTAHDVTVVYRVSGTATWDSFREPRFPLSPVTDPTTGKICIPKALPCPAGEVVFKDVDGVVLATYPPGSLCFCEDGGGVIPPEGAVEVCVVNDFGEICHDITNPAINAILWLDLQEPDDGTYLDRIDGDVFEPDAYPAVASLEYDAFATDHDAIHGTTTGGLIAAAFSTHVEEASFSGGWTIDWWMKVGADLTSTGDNLDIINLDQIAVAINYSSGTPHNVIVVRVTASDGDHLAELGYVVSDDTWRHYIITWRPDDVAAELRCYIDGVET